MDKTESGRLPDGTGLSPSGSSPQAVSPAVAASIPSAWEPIASAPKDRPILVWFDHDADPYQDPHNPGRLTDYACHAEGGDFFSGRGMVVARWNEGWYEDDGWEAANPPYWMSAAWWAQIDGDNSDYVVNPVLWMDVPAPASAMSARQGQDAQRLGASPASAVSEAETPGEQA